MSVRSYKLWRREGESQSNSNRGARERGARERYLRKKITSAILSTIDSGVHITFSRQGLTEARTSKESQKDREREKKGAKERRRNN